MHLLTSDTNTQASPSLTSTRWLPQTLNPTFHSTVWSEPLTSVTVSKLALFCEDGDVVISEFELFGYSEQHFYLGHITFNLTFQLPTLLCMYLSGSTSLTPN